VSSIFSLVVWIATLLLILKFVFKKRINGDLWIYLIPIICISAMVLSWILIAINS